MGMGTKVGAVLWQHQGLGNQPTPPKHLGTACAGPGQPLLQRALSVYLLSSQAHFRTLFSSYVLRWHQGWFS